MSQITNQSNNQVVVSTEMKNDFWTTLDLTDLDNQKKVYNVTEAQDARLDDAIGKELVIVDAIVETYSNTNEETGEVTNGRLTIMITADGESIATSSPTVFAALGKIFNIFGVASKDNPITVKAVKRDGTNNRYTTLEVL